MPTASTAATASSTLPGPTGNPAARNVRPKCIRLASSRPSACDAEGEAIEFTTRQRGGEKQEIHHRGREGCAEGHDDVSTSATPSRPPRILCVLCGKALSFSPSPPRCLVVELILA